MSCIVRINGQRNFIFWISAQNRLIFPCKFEHWRYLKPRAIFNFQQKKTLRFHFGWSTHLTSWPKVGHVKWGKRAGEMQLWARARHAVIERHEDGVSQAPESIPLPHTHKHTTHTVIMQSVTWMFRPTVSSPLDLAWANCSLRVSWRMWMACRASWRSKHPSCRPTVPVIIFYCIFS